MGPEGVAMKAKAPKANDNPFESIRSKRKFEVLGQKRKGDAKRMGLVRSAAIEKRKKTLLKEYEQSTKSSQFVDKRIGENDEALDEFGKAVLRSQRERKVVIASPLIFRICLIVLSFFNLKIKKKYFQF